MRWLIIAVAALALLPVSALAGPFSKKSPDEQRAELREMGEEVLSDLYEQKPGVQEEIQSAVGYAAFDSLGMKILLVATERGKGIAHDNRSGEDIFMKMFSGGVGIGAGISDFRVVFVFHNASTFDDFLETGWDFGAEVEGTAKTKDKGVTGTAADVTSNVSVYQFTKAGLALEVTLGGTKFWKDDDLN